MRSWSTVGSIWMTSLRCVCCDPAAMGACARASIGLPVCSVECPGNERSTHQAWRTNTVARPGRTKAVVAIRTLPFAIMPLHFLHLALPDGAIFISCVLGCALNALIKPYAMGACVDS